MSNIIHIEYTKMESMLKAMGQEELVFMLPSLAGEDKKVYVELDYSSAEQLLLAGPHLFIDDVSLYTSLSIAVFDNANIQFSAEVCV